ncbi:hypothetical protein [Oribacterium sp. WCC10]|uniref:hypothetical protein n=1 Tax=Oribacterium sp. WCC10 TaxID=1855343 RepID=UPI0008E3962B|nr:hypothetical protein [Oribacterium sp. WCC10]SFG06897.1 hypothetical protein SAMN05216356_10182 [Oribacterium sp. WCC10]
MTETIRDKDAMQRVLRYVISTIFVALLGAVYEYFSFGVYSFYMLYAFLIPFIMGILPWMILILKMKESGRNVRMPVLPDRLWTSGITTLTVGSIFHGVLDIYGTTSNLSKVYFYVGGIMMLTAIALLLGWKEKLEAEDVLLG